MPKFCLAKTCSGTSCQNIPINGKKRCRLHGGLSTGPRSAEGKARIAASHYKHGKRSKAFTEMRKKSGQNFEIEARMQDDGLI